jgi:hypothetical protein
MNNKKILVSMAAWEDTHLVDTMHKVLEYATNPDNIVFGLGLNYENEPDFSSFKNEIKIVRDKEIADGNPGIIRIRDEIRKLVTDETYFLGIDAHCDFVHGWDDSLIRDIDELTQNGEKRIISRQATALVQDHVTRITRWSMFGNYPEFNIAGSPSEVSQEELKSEGLMVNDKYFLNYYISCNFIFAKTESFKEINFPNYHRFPFEEPEQSLTTFCNGYDVVSPLSDYIVTYAANDIKYQFPYDERWWEFIGTDRNNPSHWNKIWVLDDNKMSMEVIKLMITGENKYYSLLDSKRSVADFYKAIGLEKEYSHTIKRYIENNG